jgi:hypothetical protein
VAFGHITALVYNKLIELIMAFGHNELIKLITAFDHNKLIKLIMACGHNSQIQAQCIVRLKQNANLQTRNNFQQGAPSHFNDNYLPRLIVDSDSEGARFAWTTDKNDSIASALMSLANQTYANAWSFKKAELDSQGRRQNDPAVGFDPDLKGPWDPSAKYSTLIVGYCHSKITLVFCEDLAIFCEEVKDDGNAIVSQKPIGHG